MIHLRGARADVVVDESTGVPCIVYWGAPLGDVEPGSVSSALGRAGAPLTVLPEHGSGFPGRPGLAGHRRGGTAWAPRFTTTEVRSTPRGVTVIGIDEIAGLEVRTRLELDEVLVVQCTLTNRADTRYLLDGVRVTLPVPASAVEVLTFGGRWAREMAPQRRRWDVGSVAAENRAGRTSHEHPPLVFVGEAGFGEWSGEVWGAHLAWSGNHELFADVLADGRRYVQFGELLHPGELALEPDESYATPEVVATYAADGLTPASWGYHRALRSRPSHPVTPRPVLLNTWEAVYFDHDAARLRELASVAASVGIERFVLDDGWFGARRDDTRGLGDWWVSAEAHPGGLAPLIEHVHGLGMDFGIWVEPEMVNPDSDLYRAHPEWVLTTPGYEPVLGRNQLVLDLARPDAYAHVLDALHRLLDDHDIAFVKWDMNRPHVQGSGADGAAGSHAQTLAVYRMLAELRSRHPSVEFESCASGGGRIDHEILRHTARVWTSDCNDPVERQAIQRWTSLFVPPELMGAHVGPPKAHTTGRRTSLAFRALTAMFGHMGVEWDLLGADQGERSALGEAIALHRRFRSLLHTGDTVRFDTVDDAGLAHGVYSADRDEALVACVQLVTAATSLPAPLRLPDLRPDQVYDVVAVPLPGAPAPALAPLRLTGRQLAAHGLQLPPLAPQTGILLHLLAR